MLGVRFQLMSAPGAWKWLILDGFGMSSRPNYPFRGWDDVKRALGRGIFMKMQTQVVPMPEGFVPAGRKRGRPPKPAVVTGQSRVITVKAPPGMAPCEVTYRWI